jgi:hypothetical protein
MNSSNSVCRPCFLYNACLFFHNLKKKEALDKHKTLFSLYKQNNNDVKQNTNTKSSIILLNFYLSLFNIIYCCRCHALDHRFFYCGICSCTIWAHCDLIVLSTTIVAVSLLHSPFLPLPNSYLVL